MDNGKMFEFELPHKHVKLVLEKMAPMELDEFAFEYYGKGEAYNLMVARTEKIKKEGEELEDFTGYGQKLASIHRERSMMALDLYRGLMSTLRGKVRKTFVDDKEGILDASKEEDWRKIFDISKNEDVQFLMNLADGFIKRHSPDPVLVKNSGGVSESS